MYCDTIPCELAVKLKENGYPQDHDARYVWLNGRAVDVLWMDEFERCLYDDAERDGTLLVIPSYAQVFDWFAEKGIIIMVTPKVHPSDYHIGDKIDLWIGFCNGCEQPKIGTWNEAADAAIEKALKLIKQ